MASFPRASPWAIFPGSLRDRTRRLFSGQSDMALCASQGNENRVRPFASPLRGFSVLWRAFPGLRPGLFSRGPYGTELAAYFQGSQTWRFAPAKGMKIECDRSHRPYGASPILWRAFPGFHPGLFSYGPSGTAAEAGLYTCTREPNSRASLFSGQILRCAQNDSALDEDAIKGMRCGCVVDYPSPT